MAPVALLAPGCGGGERLACGDLSPQGGVEPRAELDRRRGEELVVGVEVVLRRRPLGQPCDARLLLGLDAGLKLGAWLGLDAGLKLGGRLGLDAGLARRVAPTQQGAALSELRPLGLVQERRRR
jgi:hypothetical protein